MTSFPVLRTLHGRGSEGQVEYMKGAYSSCGGLERQDKAVLGDSSRVTYNNTACHLFREERFSLARNFFNMALLEEKRKQQAITGSVTGDKDKSKKTQASGAGKKSNRLYQCCLSHSYEADFIYNEGLASLKSGRSLYAFTCFEKVIPSFSKSPKLWIRLAECCIQYNQKPDQAVEVMKELEPENPVEEEAKVSLDKVDYASARLYLCKALHLVRSKIDYIKGSISSDSKETWDNDQQVHQLLLELEISVLVKLALLVGDNDPFNAVYHSFEALSSP